MTSPVTWLTSSHPIGASTPGCCFFVVNEEELSKLGGYDSANFEIDYHNLAVVLPKINLGLLSQTYQQRFSSFLVEK